jgi:RNA polymerase sigma factor (TIGR02999 family)
MTLMPEPNTPLPAGVPAQLFEALYADLKRLAHSRLFQGGGVVDLDTTSLVHESFLRLVQSRQLDSDDRNAFFGYVGRVMRSVVIDHLRALQSHKRGGDRTLITLTTGVEDAVFADDQLLLMDSALDQLQQLAPQFRELVELRYFAGLSVREVAELRGVSTRTVEREWEKARAFLRQLMHEA